MGGTKRKASAAAVVPDDILLEILSRLPVKSLFRFKCVSKAWSGLVADCLRKVPPTLQGLFYWKWSAGSSTMDCFFFDLLERSVPPVDPSFRFLTAALPWDEQISHIDSCNGLVLFRRERRSRRGGGAYLAITTGYIVCNPATRGWVAVPCTSCDAVEKAARITTRVVFDPAAPSRFGLLQFLFGSDLDLDVLQVHTYSSESRAWCRRATECWSHDETMIMSWMGRPFVNGMIHLPMVRRSDGYRKVIVAVDERGEKCRAIRWAEEERGSLVFAAQSQGLLHCVSAHRHQHYILRTEKLSIWVLEDYGSEQWILKGSVCCTQLFGEANWCLADATVAIHPNSSLAFFFHSSKRKLVSYDMESKEVRALGTLEDCFIPLIPFFPNFTESLVLARKHRYC
ncbi:hypothetical protein U9M48_011971 [Paspalum notatum var. saurae]|uniref:F-box domain-containing protein n=1 Tax=Paspalum notatum var. saurae TaxID=547442 RepID=A0AAQ3SWP6_PASNO